MPSRMNAAAWRLTLAAATLMALVSGGRTAFGLFVSPLNTASGMGLAALSLALAFGQLGVGLAQPVVGALADRFGAIRVILAGAVLLALTTALPAIYQLPWVICAALTASAVAGSAVGSNGVLVGEVSRGVPSGRAGLAVGLIGAGGSVGQLVMGPATQWAIDRPRLVGRIAGHCRLVPGRAAIGNSVPPAGGAFGAAAHIGRNGRGRRRIAAGVFLAHRRQLRGLRLPCGLPQCSYAGRYRTLRAPRIPGRDLARDRGRRQYRRQHRHRAGAQAIRRRPAAGRGLRGAGSGILALLLLPVSPP